MKTTESDECYMFPINGFRGICVLPTSNFPEYVDFLGSVLKWIKAHKALGAEACILKYKTPRKRGLNTKRHTIVFFLGSDETSSII